MTTPNSGQISLGDLKSELSYGSGGPDFDISLIEANSYNMNNGFYDTYGYNRIIGSQIPLTNFYDLQVPLEFEFRVESSITDYDQFAAVLENISRAGGIDGADVQPSQYNNPSSGTINPPTINALDAIHCDEIQVTVTAQNSIVPPTPPFTDLFIEYNLNAGGGYVSFPGSPYDGPSITANGGVQDNSPNDSTGFSRFTVRCTQ
jgi:hypothetical protein